MKLNSIELGDCYESINSIPDKSIDLIICDPPYKFMAENPTGGGFMNNEKKKYLTKIYNDFGHEFNPERLLQLLPRISKTINWYIFTDKYNLRNYLNYAIDNKLSFDILLWLKPNAVPVFNGHYLCDKEYLVYLRGEKATFNSNLDYKNYFTCFSYQIGQKETMHPTEKPVGLLTKIISISSNEGDIVFDPFAGSGTTLVAAKSLQRQYYGIEINPEYLAMANNRLAQDYLL